MPETDNHSRVLAFYLPQYHPIPENDEWWGRGFTEWTNVTRGRPLFRGHYQPHLPADLGFYDLRLPEVREAQAKLAREHGIHGFCYYHYWFHGKRLLERPFDEVLSSGRPDFPFCLCWANESWSRRWLGEERAVLMAQEYSAADTAAHAEYLATVFADSRYIRVRDRPLFIIYRPSHIPALGEHLAILRRTVSAAGLPEPWLVAGDGYHPGRDLRGFGFDFTLQFHPQLGVLPASSPDGWSPRRLLNNFRVGVFSPRLKVYSDRYARDRMGRFRSSHSYPTTFVSWDNSPRRGRDGIVFHGGTPEGYAADLRRALAVANQLEPFNRILFINGWNEWAEGNHLEPDLRRGRAYLEATHAVVKGPI